MRHKARAKREFDESYKELKLPRVLFNSHRLSLAWAKREKTLDDSRKM